METVFPLGMPAMIVFGVRPPTILVGNGGTRIITPMGNSPAPFGIDRHFLRMDRNDPYLSLHFIMIFVRDQERSLHFYVDRLGFRLVVDHVFETGGRWIEVAPPDGVAVNCDYTDGSVDDVVCYMALHILLLPRLAVPEVAPTTNMTPVFGNGLRGCRNGATAPSVLGRFGWSVTSLSLS